MDQATREVIRYERERPGELVHLDVKKLGNIPDGGGWRAVLECSKRFQAILAFSWIGTVVILSI